MIRSLIRWAVDNRLVVYLLTAVLVGVGGHAFWSINVEAYPDPAPAIIEVIAQFPGASAEEVERQVTIPLEVALSGMPRLRTMRSKSLFGLAHLRNQFDYSMDFQQAKFEVLNRLNLATLPDGVRPYLAPTSPTGEIFRYTIRNPRDAAGQPVYNLTDLKSFEDWTLEREFRRIPRIADVVSFGGAQKRYEIQPDPERLRQFGISLNELEVALSENNANAGGDYLLQPHTAQAVRGLGLLGGGQDPFVQIFAMEDPIEARSYLRREEERRLAEIRSIVLASTNNVPIRIGDIVEGGSEGGLAGPYSQGTVVGHHTRFGRVMVSHPRTRAQGGEERDAAGERIWDQDDDVVQGVVLLRKGEQSLPALADVEAKFHEINETPGRLPPGMKLDVFYDRTELIGRTTETVRENLVVGMVLVSGVLLLFLNHLTSAAIVAVNIPLALLFAFGVMYLRGQSANLLSLGAVDFGIIVDSSVIMVESIYRHLSSDENQHLPLGERILAATHEVDRSLMFSTLIMVCALLPLFTMDGPEGRIFGPMADAYALALAGALLLALTLSPALCRTFMTKVRPTRPNILVRGIQRFYLGQLEWALPRRKWVLGSFAVVVLATVAALPYLGREFMPELEEGNVYVRGTFPVSVSLEEVARQSQRVRDVLKTYDEARSVLVQVGRPDDGTDPTGFYNSEIFVPLKDHAEWPAVVPRSGLAGWLGGHRPRTKAELVDDMNARLDATVVGVDWNFSQSIRDNVMETLSGVKGENSLKIFGPDLGELERLAGEAARELSQVPGIQNVGIFSIMGQTNLELAIDREKCATWNVSVADVQDALSTAVAGRALSEMVEGERRFDITLRWPERLRQDEGQILDIPVDVLKNRVTLGAGGDRTAALGLLGTTAALPDPAGGIFPPLATGVPRRRLGDLVTPLDDQGAPDPRASFVRAGASTIYREQGQRFIAVKFSVRDRDLAGAVAEAQGRTKPLVETPYRTEWSGEFQEMQDAFRRLVIVLSLALVVILVLLYLALRTILDVLVVFANVLVMSLGGVWALLLTGSTFNISAGVGFISVLGVGTMNGLLLVSGFNHRRAQGMSLSSTVRDGVAQWVRPLTMTALTAIFGMLPAAFSTKMGSESQRPLAIVVVGGMGMTLLFLNLLPLLYSLYGNREPPRVTAPTHG